MAKNEKRTNGARYRRSAAYVTELVDYIPALADAQKDFMLSRVQKVVVNEMRKQVTYREAESLELYFVQGYNYKQISQALQNKGDAQADLMDALKAKIRRARR